ncbi:MULTISPECIES: hypothetical protein [unclassified Ornithinimicrobium]|uniref:hypothetical protein n=1 Tax=unclassified Ornithinimicrobium TaxID=2615080 RepID=UPI0038526D9A
MGRQPSTVDQGEGLYSLDEAVAALAGWKIGPVRAWLEDQLRVAHPGCAADLAALEASAWWNDGLDHEVDLPGAVERLWGAAVDDDDAAATLVLFVRFASMLAWEQEWEVDGISTVVDMVTGLVAADARHDVRSALQLLSFLLEEFRVESASLGGTLKDWSCAARDAAAEAAVVQDEVGRGPRSTVRDYVLTEIGREVDYYGAVAAAAGAVDGLPSDGGVGLTAAVDRLLRVEAHEDPIDRSELRAHRLGLEALQDAVHRPWLRLSSGRLSVLYPFALRGLSPAAVIERSSNADGWWLGGAPVVSRRPSLPINDMWRTDDPLGRGFRGVALRLPEVLLTDAHGKERLELHPEVWLSELGNHLLRLDARLVDATPLDLEHVLRVLGPEGAELDLPAHRLRSILPSPDDRHWATLAAYAEAVLVDLAAELSGDPDGGDALTFFPSLVTTVLVVDQAESWVPATGHRAPVEDGAELRSLVGAQILTQPVGIVTSIGQWILTAPGPVVEDVTGTGRGSWIARTENTATVVAFEYPSYALDMLTDCVIFTASLTGLFAGWNHDLSAFNDELAEHLGTINVRLESEETAPTSEEIRVVEQELERRQLLLHDMVARCRSVIMFVEAPTLLGSPIMRSLVDRLLAGSQYERMVKGFNDSASALAAGRMESVLAKVRVQLETLEQEEATRRERKVRIVTEALLAGVAVAGISGVASLIQAGYDMGPVATVLMVSFVLTLSVLIALVVWLSNRRE